MKTNTNFILGITLLSLGLGACAESVIDKGIGHTPYMATQPTTPGQVESELNKPVTMTFKINPDNNYTGNPVEAIFPGQAEEGYAIDNIQDSKFRFDLEIIPVTVGAKDPNNKEKVWDEATGSLKIELIQIAKKKTKKKKTKKANDSGDKEDPESQDLGEDEAGEVELTRSFVTDGLLKLRTEKDLDKVTGRFKDVDGEDVEATHLFIEAQRKHAKSESDFAKNPWSGTVYLVEDSKQVKVGEINGFFFKKTPAQARK